DSIGSAAKPDGARCRGAVVSGPTASGEPVTHSGSEVRAILAMLRSRSHPEGFRYELLITGLTSHSKSYTLTASLKPSLSDSPVASTSKQATRVNSRSSEADATH